MACPSPNRFLITLVLPLVLLSGSCVHRPAPETAISVRPGPYRVQRQLSQLDTLPAGDHPKSVTISPAQSSAYVCNLEQGTVDIMSTETGERTGRLRFRRQPVEVTVAGKTIASFEEKPVEVAFTGNGRFVWISLLNAGGVVVYDTALGARSVTGPSKTVEILDGRNRVVKTMKLRFIATGSQPKVIAVEPGQKRLFVSNWRGMSVTVVDAVKFQKIKNISVGMLPRGICFVDGRAYVSNFGSHTLSEIDLAHLRVRNTVQNVGKNPRHLVSSLDGHTIYISNHGDSRIRQFEVKRNRVTGVCRVGREPRTIALSRYKNFLFVAEYADDSISVVDLLTFQPVARMKTLSKPVGLSVDLRSDTVWVSGYTARALRRYRFKSVLQEDAGSVQLVRS
jgi:YVTN family beta-propeller protein